MEVSARLKMARISPQKLRMVVKIIKGLSAGDALDQLKFGNTHAAKLLHKLLKSAVANAENNHGADIDELKVQTVRVDQGPTYKRMRARARGRSSRILKRTSHVAITLADGQGLEV